MFFTANMKFLQKLDRLFTGRERSKEPWGIQDPWDLIIDSSLEQTNPKPMMLKVAQALKSRTFWTLVALFIINGINGIHNQIPPALLTLVDVGMTMLATYFHVNPRQNYSE
jgi:hypothetical protein